MADRPESCDYLILGGGSAGCVVARRLADRTGAHVVLVEAGPTDAGVPAANDVRLLDDQPEDWDWGFSAATLPGGPPVLAYSRARLLGGCANHNDCAFVRPPDSDFAAWEAVGGPGWGPVEMRRLWHRILDTVPVETAPCHPLSRAFIDAGRELGLPEVDFRDGIRDGVGLFPLNAAGPMRRSSSVAYLHTGARPANLDILTGTLAKRILFEGHRATGAETSAGPIMARREVILACGAIQTPQLMMVSGLGPAPELRRHGIAVRRDIPALGRHLRDHVAAPVVWETRDAVDPWDITPFEATLMLTLRADSPAPDILFHFGLRVREKYGDDPRLPVAGPAVKASPNVTRARSEGEIRLTGPDITDKPAIHLNYFADTDDLDLLVAAMRFTRRLGRTDALRRVTLRELHPGPEVVTEEDWRAYVRRTCETVYHPCGTAAIGRVTAPDLTVPGIAGLRIADASVLPSLPTVNINSAVMLAAERAGELIAP